MARPPLPIGSHGQITVRKTKGGAWVARATMRDVTGKRRDITAQAPTRAAAHTKLQAKIAAHSKGAVTPTTLGDAIDAWHDTYTAGKSHNTIQQREKMVRVHLTEWRDLQLIECTVPTLDRIIAAAAKPRKITSARGKKITVGGVSAAKTVRIVLNLIMQEAVRSGAIPFNAAAATRVPHTPRKKVRALAPAEVREIIDIVDAASAPHVPGAGLAHLWLPDMVRVLAGTGLRIGECVALKWKDYDPAQRTLHVHATAIIMRGSPVLQDKTKTGAERVVHLPSWCADALDARALRFNAKLDDYIFQNRYGGMISLGIPTRRLHEMLPERFGWVTPHTFRRTVATTLERELGIEAAQAQLGHASVSTTQFYVARRTMAIYGGALEKLGGKSGGHEKFTENKMHFSELPEGQNDPARRMMAEIEGLTMISRES